MKKGVIIQASSRSQGNTSKIVNAIQQQTNFDVIDLTKYNIGHFNYEFNNNDDDFNALFKSISSKYETIVFATPIYWYTMSGMLKVFLDRISDFLFNEKDVGRRLRGKNMAAISCGSDSEIFDGFLMPFEQSANYLGMNFLGHIHTWIEDNEDISTEIKHKIEQFSEVINQATN